MIEEMFGKAKRTCQHCSELMNDDDDVCNACGHMQDLQEDDELNQSAPPGEEKLVKKLKKQPDVDNPWALAWSIHNKKKKR